MKFKSIQPVQIIGTQRSGSNLLRLMLNQHPQICAPHPPHILQRFFPLLEAYGDLAFTENLENLLTDVLKLVALNPISWNLEPDDFQQISHKIRKPSLTDVFRSIYEWKAEKEMAGYWVCKSMSNVHVADILEEDINPLYIYLYRDGRDVAASFKKVVVGEKHIYHLAQQWKKDQQACLHLKEQMPATRFLEVCYESLIADPEKEMGRIVDFLGVAYTSDFVRYYQSEESGKAASAGNMWTNLIHPCMPANHHKYLAELSKEEIGLFEYLAGDVLRQLGYSLHFENTKHLQLTHADLAKFDAENQRLKNNIRYIIPCHDYEKMMPQQRWIHEISNRRQVATAS